MASPLKEVSEMANWHTGAAGSGCRIPYACYAAGLPAQTADVLTVALAGQNRQVAAASDCLRSGHAIRGGRTHGRPPLCGSTSRSPRNPHFTRPYHEAPVATAQWGQVA